METMRLGFIRKQPMKILLVAVMQFGIVIGICYADDCEIQNSINVDNVPTNRSYASMPFIDAIDYLYRSTENSVLDSCIDPEIAELYFNGNNSRLHITADKHLGKVLIDDIESIEYRKLMLSEFCLNHVCYGNEKIAAFSADEYLFAKAVFRISSDIMAINAYFDYRFNDCLLVDYFLNDAINVTCETPHASDLLDKINLIIYDGTLKMKLIVGDNIYVLEEDLVYSYGIAYY